MQRPAVTSKRLSNGRSLQRLLLGLYFSLVFILWEKSGNLILVYVVPSWRSKYGKVAIKLTELVTGKVQVEKRLDGFCTPLVCLLVWSAACSRVSWKFTYLVKWMQNFLLGYQRASNSVGLTLQLIALTFRCTSKSINIKILDFAFFKGLLFCLN